MENNKMNVFQKTIDLFNKQMIDGSVLTQNNGYILQSLLYTFAEYHNEIKNKIRDQKSKQRLDNLYNIMINYIKVLFVEVQKHGC